MEMGARGDRWSHAPPIPKTEWPAHDSTDAPRLAVVGKRKMGGEKLETRSWKLEIGKEKFKTRN